ncbi:hypothetical protein Tco_0919590 [Tanacetum coccineum]
MYSTDQYGVSRSIEYGSNPTDILDFVTDYTNHIGLIEEAMTETMTELTMEEYVDKTRGDYYSGISKTMVNGKVAYELKGRFLDDLHKNAFSGTN